MKGQKLDLVDEKNKKSRKIFRDFKLLYFLDYLKTIIGILDIFSKSIVVLPSNNWTNIL